MAITEMARLDVRLAKKQKELFEEAVDLGGYSTLTQFIVSAAIEKATSIIEEHKNWLSSERDRETFFAVLASPPKPNAYLKDAVKNYNASLKEPIKTRKASAKK
ncbi:Uncharacterized conserved protein, DUF1778 family [Chryseolinea serpens]|uniref:Uncharacterized conserved protein, DUF1778 family n=1 Tax=Chryseolinea serpens TaxID=947013 RepID=A0A1M5WJE9_9BACT|nr:DUF1778 domain-containing protein [Chryseolinea serpens]SHH87283.1 Uncharacterized conserved protein, DUF1778 family [Chryseolinea serpens]